MQQLPGASGLNHTPQCEKEHQHEGATLHPNHLEPPMPLPSVILPEMCYYCFDVLIAFLYNQEAGYLPAFTNAPYPLFITWKIGRERKLRGCIGTFDPFPLHKGLRDYAIKSSMEDNRFQPITLPEVSKLDCAVSLLLNFCPGLDCYDWEVGVHGITIEFSDQNKKRLKATYLPEVALEQGWSKEETLNSLLRKAGLKGPVTRQVMDSISLVRYQTEKHRASYHEYIDLWYNRNI